MLPSAARALPGLRRWAYPGLNRFGYRWYRPVFLPRLLGLARQADLVHSLASGYLGACGSTTWVAGGPLPTGDAGFLLDGELFVLGRQGDALKIRGRAVFAESIEARLAEIGNAPRRVVVAMGALAEADMVVVAYEGQATEAWRAAALRLTKADLQGTPVTVAVSRVPRGSIGYTSSGKPRRRAFWSRFARGDIPVAADVIL